jgi:hypothetical protein
MVTLRRRCRLCRRWPQTPWVNAIPIEIIMAREAGRISIGEVGREGFEPSTLGLRVGRDDRGDLLGGQRDARPRRLGGLLQTGIAGHPVRDWERGQDRHRGELRGELNVAEQVRAALCPVAAAISSPTTSFGISASASVRLMIES